MTTFTITPTGTFHLAEAANFGFGSRIRTRHEPRMRLAFCLDGGQQLVGVALRQPDDGTVVGEVTGDADVEAVQRQVARVLSLDHDGAAWAQVVQRDAVLASVVGEHPGMRPVLFHSPYEALAWAVISARVSRQQAAPVRDRVARELGQVFELDGEQLAAFPTPERLLEVEPGAGLPAVKVDRLHALAREALTGSLEADVLQALGPDEATARVLQLPGIGPFYAALAVVRGTGFADALPDEEPITLASIGELYGMDGPATSAQASAIAQAWRPFRTWASVHLHARARRTGVTKASAQRR